MTVLMILLSIVAVLWVGSLIRLGIRVRYCEDGLLVVLLIGPVKFRILPVREKKHKKDRSKGREKEQIQQTADLKQENRPDILSRVLELLPTFLEAAGALRRKICVNDVCLTLIWGGPDPASVAVGYGRANAVFGMIWPLFEHNFKVRRREINIGMDYDRTKPKIEGAVKVTITIGQIVALGCWYGLKILKLWIRSGRAAAKQQEV